MPWVAAALTLLAVGVVAGQNMPDPTRDLEARFLRAGHGAAHFRVAFNYYHFSNYSETKHLPAGESWVTLNGALFTEGRQACAPAAAAATTTKTTTAGGAGESTGEQPEDQRCAVNVVRRRCDLEGVVLYGGRGVESEEDTDYAYFGDVRILVRDGGSCAHPSRSERKGLSWRRVDAASVVSGTGRGVQRNVGGERLPTPREGHSFTPLGEDVFRPPEIDEQRKEQPKPTQWAHLGDCPDAPFTPASGFASFSYASGVKKCVPWALRANSYAVFGGYSGSSRGFLDDFLLLHVHPPAELNRDLVTDAAASRKLHRLAENLVLAKTQPAVQSSAEENWQRWTKAGREVQDSLAFDVRWERPLVSNRAALPSPRYRHAAVAVGPLFLVHGGFGPAGLLGDLWLYDTLALVDPKLQGQGFRPLSVSNMQIAPRGGHAAALLTMGQDKRVFAAFAGGVTALGPSNEAFLLSTGCVQKNATWVQCDRTKLQFSWVRLQLAGVAGSPRLDHVAFRVVEKDASAVYVVGGIGFREPLQPPAADEPPRATEARRPRMALLSGDALVARLQCRALVRDDLTDKVADCSWERLPSPAALAPRRGHAAALFPGEGALIISGAGKESATSYPLVAPGAEGTRLAGVFHADRVMFAPL